MSNASVRICADTANSGAAAELAELLDAESVSGDADIALVSGPPADQAPHVVVTGDLTDSIDEWDRGVAPQTMAGALWIAPDQDAALVAAAWWLLRHETPTTPLSDLTDTNDRALRWSVVAVRRVDLTGAGDPPAVSDEAIREDLDRQPQVQALGAAIDRIGGEDAEAVLTSVERFRAAMADLDTLADIPPASATAGFDTALAAHLRQVQRTGFGRWRGAKARAQSQEDLQTAAKKEAADRLRQVIAARQQAEHEALVAAADHALVISRRHAVEQALAELTLPVAPDFSKSPRSWTDSPTPARTYALAAEQHLDLLSDLSGATVRANAQIPASEVLCVRIQSGFSLPALRTYD